MPSAITGFLISIAMNPTLAAQPAVVPNATRVSMEPNLQSLSNQLGLFHTPRKLFHALL